MTQENPQLTITLSNRRPVTINKSEWPILAQAAEKPDDLESHESHDVRKLFVRTKGKGKARKAAVVYGFITGGGKRGGLLLDDDCDDAAIEDAVKEVARELGFTDYLVSNCLSKLPPEEI